MDAHTAKPSLHQSLAPLLLVASVLRHLSFFCRMPRKTHVKKFYGVSNKNLRASRGECCVMDRIRQNLYRVRVYSLCRILLSHGKLHVSGSGYFRTKYVFKCQCQVLTI